MADPKITEQNPPEKHAETHASGGADELKLSDLAAPDAPIQFAGQQAVGLRVENRTDDPADPLEGQIWLRTDLI